MATTHNKPIPNLPQKYIDRFWGRVHKMANGCWFWTGNKDKDGYGEFGFRQNGIRGKVRTHRYAFFLHYGHEPIPYACHKCDFPPCVNPEHLYEGDHFINTMDMKFRGRTAKGDRNGMRSTPNVVTFAPGMFPAQLNPPKGSKNANCKLTEEAIIEIRRSFESGDLEVKDLAFIFKISRHHVRDILHRKSWSHL